MPTEKEVYESHADQYELLILREDYQENIPKEISKVHDPQGLTIIELGAGTGRLTRDLIQKASRVFATDASLHMLSKSSKVLGKQNSSNYLLSVSDMRRTPFPANCADMIVAGWSFCYLSVWGGNTWQSEVDEGIYEAKRLLKPGGVFLLLESFGTGTETPDPPPHLMDYLDYLKFRGFDSAWFRTDYQFSSRSEAVDLSRFFFGETMAEKINKNNWTILPECTAIYWLKT